MKLSGQASQYWTNIENRHPARGRPPIDDTWDRMKKELERKCHHRLVLVLWTIGIKHAQGNKSANEYVENFDEFLIRCSTLHREGKVQILSRFKAGLRDDLRTELLGRGVNELEAVYALVQDLDYARPTHTSKSHDYRASMSRPSPFP